MDTTYVQEAIDEAEVAAATQPTEASAKRAIFSVFYEYKIPMSRETFNGICDKILEKIAVQKKKDDERKAMEKMFDLL